MATKKKSKKKSFISFNIIFIVLIIATAIWAFTSESEKAKEPATNDYSNGDIKENEEIDNDNNKVTPDENEEAEDTEDTQVDKELEEEEVPHGDYIEDNFDESSIDNSSLSNKTYGWSFKRNSDHSKPIGYSNGINLSTYGAYYLVNTDEKVIYLTYDAGYENGYTAPILDALRDNNVTATFFVTKSYIENNVNLVKRMKEEGHLVGNHSVTHPSFPDLTDEEIEWELTETAKCLEELTGYKMDTFFRPPKGEYSERTMYLTRKLGYRTIFWSLTYLDWDVNKQPGKEYAYNHVMDNYHNGAIVLLHAVSESNAQAMDDILKELLAKGYRFGSLYEIE